MLASVHSFDFAKVWNSLCLTSLKIARNRTLRILKILVCVTIFGASLFAAKVKDITNIVGVRDNQLVGYGLVVGLNGSGDGTTSVFTTQSLANLLASVNVKIDANAIKSKNIAAVMVTANIPPFAKQGDKIDIYVSSIGDAKSLEGGNLIMTPLKGVNGMIYALAQGVVATGGFNAGGRGQKNHVTAATLKNGALIEREIGINLSKTDATVLSLKTENFQNALKIQNAINKVMGSPVAFAQDSRTLKLTRPENMSPVEFIAKVGEVAIEPERTSKIVIDEKTGTIIAGSDIKIDPVVITHGDITIKVRTQNDADPKADGKKVVDMGDGVVTQIDNNVISSLQSQMTVSSLMRALQKLGAKPRDIISIIEAMKTAGALHADLEVI
jgi:flagellar P-ring protein FlgI